MFGHLDPVSQGRTASGQIVVDPGVECFAQLHHGPVVQRQDGLPLLVEAQISDERVDVEIGIIGPTRFMLKERGHHVAGRARHFLLGQGSSPIPHRRRSFQPGEFFFDGGEHFRFQPRIAGRGHREGFRGRIGELLIFDFRLPRAFQRVVSRERRRVRFDEGAEFFCRDGLPGQTQFFRQDAVPLAGILEAEVIARLEMLGEVAAGAFA